MLGRQLAGKNEKKNWSVKFRKNETRTFHTNSKTKICRAWLPKMAFFHGQIPIDSK
jgi:hypothetical protein